MLGESAGRSRDNSTRNGAERRTIEQRSAGGPYPDDDYEDLYKPDRKLIYWGAVCILAGIALLCLGIALVG
jgi:hypothetical protein